MTQNKKKKRVEEEPMEVDNPGPTQNGGNHENDLLNGEIDHISDDEEGGIRIGDIYIPPAPKPALTFDSTGPRLIITHIVNDNFKSYAGTQTLGPFHKSFTAIIGPNGSGKSNVIDSMLFVFGYRATKIRSKKISVLIHSSSKYPHLNSACVAVHFCQIIDGEGEDFTIVPNSEIVVARTAFKDNSSFYTLNNRRVQFKEVGKMLRSHGIDLDHNRFLILQGEVEQIAMMKPKGQSEHETGMLEYLEDIIGTSRYKEPIEKLAVRVEEYSELRKEKLNRVRLVEQEKEKLEQPMREAVDQMNLTNTALRTRNMLLQKYIHETNKIIEGKNKEMDELKANLKKIDDCLENLKSELNEKTAVLKEGTQKYDVLQKKKEELTEKLQSCKKKTVTVQSDMTIKIKKKKNLDQLLEQERGKLMDLELIPEKNNREIEDCKKLLVKHTETSVKAKQEMEGLMANVRTKTKGLQEERDILLRKLMVLKSVVEATRKKLNVAQSQLRMYMETETVELKKLEKFKSNYEIDAQVLNEKKTQQKELSSSVPIKEKKLSEITSQLQSIRSEESTLAEKANTLRGQLEESKQTMSANKSRGRVLDALMKEKRNGKFTGIFGRLGDLGGIDLKYDVAISTCCPALDNIVVDSVQTAQACMEYLCINDIGRTTFIALDQLTHLLKYTPKKTDCPENVPRLFDLVRVTDKRVLPAFYFALRDTLVANDLEQATRIAYGATRYRVVSLRGDVIEISGTMSGGGKIVMKGRMASSVQTNTNEQDPRVLRQNEELLTQYEERLSELRSQQTNLESTVVSLEKDVKQGRTTLDKITLDVKNLTVQVPGMKRNIEEQEKIAASKKIDEKKKKELEEVVKEMQAEFDTAKEKAAEIKKEVAAAEAKISAIGGTRVELAKKTVEDLNKKIDKVKLEINKLSVAIGVSARNAKKCKDKIHQMEVDLKDTEATLENLNAQKKQLTLDTQQMQKELEQIEEDINEGSDEFSGLKKEIAKLQAKENKIKGERIEANNEVNKMEKTIQDCKGKMPLWERDLSALKLEDPGLVGIPGVERPEPLVKHTLEELEQATVEELRSRFQAQKNRLGDTKPNIQAIKEYKAKDELYLKRAAELDEITTKRNEMRTLYDQLRKKRSTDFLSGFNTITGKLKEMYQMITLGGDAELELVDSLDPFTEGIIFSVRPPNKSWKNISNLSGGEKTLSSLALVFALHYYKPTPLYVMDEIDAALDFKNVSIVANYIKERTRNAQFIIISLRYNMFEVSDRLVGIFKTEDCTKSVTIENKLPVDEPNPIENVLPVPNGVDEVMA